MKYKVAALTVVKDEAVYIIDWINHCFYFGFEEVHIAVNRTTDKTMLLLEQVTKSNDKVKVYCTDWIDLRPDKSGINTYLQYYSFCFLINEALKNSEITHVFPLDADEYWFPSDFQMPISNYISSLPEFDMLSVNWAAQSADDKPFMLPFENNHFTLMNNVKSILSRSCVHSIKRYQLHIPEMKIQKYIHLNTQGEQAQSLDNRTQRISFNSELEMTSMILHRMVRSEKEYLSLLLKQRPSSTLPIKDNRNGLNRKFESMLSINAEIKCKYEEYLLSRRSPFSDVISESQSDILNKLKLYEEISIDIISTNIKVFIKVLKGTRMLGVILDKFLLHSFDADELRDAAVYLEKIDITYSFKLIEKAAVIRPQGPRIRLLLEAKQLSLICKCIP